MKPFNCALASVFVFLAGTNLWAVPAGFNVQGRLTDANGINKDGTFQIKFSVFTTATGGSSVWEKNLPAVPVKNGNFQVVLQGQGDNAVQLEDAVRNLEAAYVEIKVGTELPLVPRQPLLRSPFSSPDKVAGKGDILIQSDSQNAGSGNVVVKTGNTDRLTILNNGNVGVGTIAPTSKLEVNGRIKDQTGYLTPVGTIIAYASVTPPQGWLYCNGQSVPKDNYADLFAVIGCTFGCDASTFKLMDLRGEFIRGFDDGRGVDSGRGLGTAQLDAFQGHAHNAWQTPGYYGGSAGGSAGSDDSYMFATSGPVPQAPYGTPRVAAETRPRNISLSYMIKY